ncbi:MAG TPA: flavodoxin domain-containing protein [Armatimonadota bacterium]|jgi:flavodoxin
MNALVIFDTTYGNTKQIAEAIAGELGARAVRVDEVSAADLNGLDLLVVGSPINAWRPSEKMLKFLAELSDGQLKGSKAAAFDTRVKLFIHGDAAKKITESLKKAGAEIIANPQAFYVKGMEGPLLETEVARALAWGKQLKQ